MSIVLVGSTSGSITLQEPAVSGSTVLSLPAVSGTLITTGSSGQSIPKAALPTGSVLQVVSGTTATEASSTTSSYADTGLTASITPTSSSSKILILVGQRLFCNSDAGVNGGLLKLMRDSTDLVLADRIGLSDSTGAMDVYFATAYLDSPATTSSITYKTRFARNSSSGTVFVQLSSARATITLMEIAA